MRMEDQDQVFGDQESEGVEFLVNARLKRMNTLKLYNEAYENLIKEHEHQKKSNKDRADVEVYDDK